MAKNVGLEVTGLLEQAKQAAIAAKDQALINYRQMLESDEGDPKKLLDVMQILGKTAEDLETDAAAIKSAVQLQQTADRYQEHQGKFSEMVDQIETANKAFDAIKEKHDAAIRNLENEASICRIDMDAARQANSKLTILKWKHWQLFGLPKPMDSNAPTNAVLNSL